MNKLSMLFLIDKTRLNKNNKVPLRCRITYLSKRKIFSMGIFINPKNWNSSRQKAIPDNVENNQINTQLSLIKQEINQAFLYLKVQEKSFDVEDVFKQYKGETIKEDQTIMGVFNLHIARQEKLIGVSTTQVSVAKFHQTKQHLKTFIKWEFQKSDYLLKDLQMSFITEFEYYLKAEKKFEANTIQSIISLPKPINPLI